MSVTPDYDYNPVDCPICGHAGTMVVPDYSTDYPDGNIDASERMCLDCGSALFIDPVTGPSARTA